MTRAGRYNTLLMDVPSPPFLFVGTYSTTPGTGIFSGRFTKGRIEGLRSTADVANASFLALHRKGRVLYAVSELPAGQVVACAIEPHDGSLRVLGRVSSHGAGPCHIALDAHGALLVVANYTGGSICVRKLSPEGSFEHPPSVVQHTGSSSHTTRQNKAHPHGAFVATDGRYAIVPDLGLDRLFVYQIRPHDGMLVLASISSTPAGSGPRHFAFHPSGRLGYVVNELKSTLTSYRYDRATGLLSQCHTSSTLAPGFQSDNIAGEIAVAPDGRFLYVSNRGADTVAVFELSGDGEMRMIQSIASGGKTPRHIAFDPAGRFLLAGNQDSNGIAIFVRDPRSGELTPACEQIHVPAPACLLFAPQAGC
jgi:6-phosphogluconolactonase